MNKKVIKKDGFSLDGTSAIFQTTVHVVVKNRTIAFFPAITERDAIKHAKLIKGRFKDFANNKDEKELPIDDLNIWKIKEYNDAKNDS